MCGVVGIAGAARNPPRDRVDAVVVATKQLVEREAIAGSCSFDQLIVVGLECDAASVLNSGAAGQPLPAMARVGAVARCGIGSAGELNLGEATAVRELVTASVVASDLGKHHEQVASVAR